MLKKMLLKTLFLSISLVLFSACGGGGGGDSQNTTQETFEAIEVNATANESVSVYKEPIASIVESVVINEDTNDSNATVGVMTLAKGVEPDTTWQKDKIVIFNNSDEFPEGYAIKITSVEQNASGNYSVSYTIPSLDDIVDEVDYEYDNYISPDMIQNITYDSDTNQQSQSVVMSIATSSATTSSSSDYSWFPSFGTLIVSLENSLYDSKIDDDFAAANLGVKEINFGLQDFTILQSNDKTSAITLSGNKSIQDLQILLFLKKSKDVKLKMGVKVDYIDETNIDIVAKVDALDEVLADHVAEDRRCGVKRGNGLFEISGAKWREDEVCVGGVSISTGTVTILTNNGENATIPLSLELFFTLNGQMKLSSNATLNISKAAHQRMYTLVDLNQQNSADRLKQINTKCDVEEENKTGECVDPTWKSTLTGTLEGEVSLTMGIAAALQTYGIQPIVAQVYAGPKLAGEVSVDTLNPEGCLTLDASIIKGYAINVGLNADVDVDTRWLKIQTSAGYNYGWENEDVLTSFYHNSTCKDANAIPTANAGADQTVTAGATVTLNGLASSDSDGSIVSYVWKDSQGNVVSESVDYTFFTLSSTQNQESFTYTLTVTDNNDATATDSVVVTINPQPSTLTYAWQIGTWGTCTGACGTDQAEQNRTVTCQASDGSIAEDAMCTDIKPVTTQACTASECAATPYITNFYPTNATQNQATTFTVEGINLPDTIAMSLEGSVTDSCSLLSHSSTQATMSCVPSTTGSVHFYVATESGGEAIASDIALLVDVTYSETANSCGLVKNNHTLASKLFNLDPSIESYDNPGYVTAPYLMDGYEQYIPGLAAHAGVDLRSKNSDGTVARDPVYSLVSGDVVRSDNGTSFGAVSIRTYNDQGQTVLVSYGHLDETLVQVGDTIHAGTLVGYTGNMGAPDAPHLHVEYRVNYTGTSMVYNTSCGDTDCSKDEIAALTQDPVDILDLYCASSKLPTITLVNVTTKTAGETFTFAAQLSSALDTNYKVMISLGDGGGGYLAPTEMTADTQREVFSLSTPISTVGDRVYKVALFNQNDLQVSAWVDGTYKVNANTSNGIDFSNLMQSKIAKGTTIIRDKYNGEYYVIFNPDNTLEVVRIHLEVAQENIDLEAQANATNQTATPVADAVAQLYGTWQLVNGELLMTVSDVDADPVALTNSVLYEGMNLLDFNVTTIFDQNTLNTSDISTKKLTMFDPTSGMKSYWLFGSNGVLQVSYDGTDASYAEWIDTGSSIDIISNGQTIVRITAGSYDTYNFIATMTYTGLLLDYEDYTGSNPTLPANITEEMLSGKIFYIYESDEDGDKAQELTFENGTLTVNLTITKDGNVSQETSVAPYSIENGEIKLDLGTLTTYMQLINQTDTFMEMITKRDMDQNGMIDGSSSLVMYLYDRGLSTITNTTITQDMLDGKTFYDFDVNQEGLYDYATMRFSAGTLTRVEHYYNANGIATSTETMEVPYSLINDRVRVDLTSVGDGILYIALKLQNPDSWDMNFAHDYNVDSIPDSINTNIFYISKPSYFPSEL
ncbi:PKD domain-containing protein [Sulfurimonas sp.]|uniref:M23 family metallopeptidase n=1 Tax=Sulfurimonas sp. TaxID=2022749 RepID=UPI003D0A1F9F